MTYWMVDLCIRLLCSVDMSVYKGVMVEQYILLSLSDDVYVD